METKQLRHVVTVRIYGEEKCFGPGIAELLERVDQTRSLRRASKDMGMAYSKAWRIMKTAEENLGFALLQSQIGGSGGGGAELTKEARCFLTAYRRFEQAVQNYAAEAFLEIMG